MPKVVVNCLEQFKYLDSSRATEGKTNSSDCKLDTTIYSNLKSFDVWLLLAKCLLNNGVALLLSKYNFLL